MLVRTTWCLGADLLMLPVVQKFGQLKHAAWPYLLSLHTAALSLIQSHACLPECCFCIVQTAQGHGDAVNDITVHPTKPALFVTASRVSNKSTVSVLVLDVCSKAIM